MKFTLICPAAACTYYNFDSTILIGFLIFDYCVILAFAVDQSVNRLPEIEPQMKTTMDSDDIWDEGIAAGTGDNTISEPEFETIRVKHYTSVVPIRGYNTIVPFK